ncbi:MAG: hypothetical protein JW863_09350 [Chitinispirillaceae bacterium]|nr:hypothetical protein [Chitinispirillaceae bacterium]
MEKSSFPRRRESTVFDAKYGFPLFSSILNRPYPTIVVMLFCAAVAGAAENPGGLGATRWGQSADEVRTASGAQSWQTDPTEKNFPPDLSVTVFRATGEIAGYKASTRYYFQNNRLFQATIDFNFDELKNFDFNYNVFRSVNEYYVEIRTKTILFVNDIFSLLESKYGKKRPVFKGLDPRKVFSELNRYVMQERWNLRYHPYDYYLHIVTASYARWDFQHTRVLFSLNIAASQKRFDYQLSLSSTDMTGEIRKAMDMLRSRGL